MKKFLCSLAVLCCITSSAFATELFPGTKADTFTPFSALPTASTAGGYAIYQGDEPWLLSYLNTRETGALGDAQPITMGILGVQQVTPEAWVASMYTTVNLTGAGLNQFMTGNPCAGSHLIRNEKSRRQDDNCLTVDAERENVGQQQLTVLALRISHAKSAGRVYRLFIFLNPDALGFKNTALADWTPDAVAAVPERAAFVQRLQKWAESLQDASERALDFKKPQDAFAGIPALRTLGVAPVTVLVPEPK